MEHFLAPSTPSSSTLNASQSNIRKSTASSTILSATAGIIDTGTTLILTPSNAFSTYQSAPIRQEHGEGTPHLPAGAGGTDVHREHPPPNIF
ncbi:hypothetical protein EV702DRAFT_1211843 [Suillus placidus]|uniref:Peptidase A1 domain-containing protein n=1 Tax=Suillus placidus TaxID=48579 RepID=A0A9P7D693_9AGAM|nr:hypothetical protein EV702DRAFT_1211843 [Suillus placidus]